MIKIDPKFYINYERSPQELEAFFLFCICVAGKTASTIAPKIEKVYSYIEDLGFTSIFELSTIGFDSIIRKNKLGKYNLLNKMFLYMLMSPHLKLQNISIEEFEKVPGVGMKTSRYFKLGTDPKAKCAAVDTHVLKFLKDMFGVMLDVPKVTPSSKKKYLEFENLFLHIYSFYQNRISLAEFDLMIWRYYSEKLEKDYGNIHNYLNLKL